MKGWLSRLQMSVDNVLGEEKVPLLRSDMPCVLRRETWPLIGRRRGWLFWPWGADMLAMTGPEWAWGEWKASGYESRQL
jgi:hypothetical protein